MQLLKLVSHQVKVGAPLPFNIRDEQGCLLLACGQLIFSDAQLEHLLERGIFADVEEIKALAAGQKVEAKPPGLFVRWNQIYWTLDALSRPSFDTAQLGQAMEQLGDELIAMVRLDPDVAIYQMMRQERHPLRMYGLTHAVYAAALSLLMGARMGWDEHRQRLTVLAALSMNLTAFELQGRFAVHGRLTQEQRDELRQHPLQTVERLKAAGVSDTAWLQSVIEHHEHADGSGYPRGITQPCETAQLLRLVDVFLAKISRRESRPAMDCKDAERQAFAEQAGNPMAAALIKEFGLYPPGELLELASGEKAVVIRRGASLQTPLVAALTDKHGLPCTKTLKRDTAQAEFAIRSVDPDKALVCRVPLERLYGLIG